MSDTQKPELPEAPCGNRDYCSRHPFCGCGAPDDGLPERDRSKPEEQQGLFRKFTVSRTDNSDLVGGKHYGCEYFVLDINHDKAAPVALAAYADAIEATHPALAEDMRERYGLATPPDASARIAELESVCQDYQINAASDAVRISELEARLRTVERDALERAAQVCDKEAPKWRHPKYSYAVAAVMGCGSRIRALKEQTT